ncbi:Wzz/FepE/Etk N-terminal domain-containing protein [Rhodanobacter umsongensis]|uniref:Wzz/FepE/Etk N-terminal domain-containing protein n=1 Tax=Rhodanobacter umsongensis TaxID=633153 RepID=A0ABW0JK52_9GAMM
MEQDEIYLIDLWRIFIREWKWFAGVLVLTLVCTYAFAHLVKRQWEASAWIQIAQVGQVPSGQDPKVEPLARVLERLQLVPFQNEVMAGAGFSPESAQAKLYRKSLKLEPLPYAGPLIRLNVRAYSRQQARQFAAATVAQLHALHRRLEALPLNSARARLARVEADLQTTLADQARLQQAATIENGRAGNSRGAASPVLASLLLADKNEEVRALQQARSDLIDRLGPAYTYETSLMWPVYVPDRQAFPNPELTYGIGMLLSLFLGASAAIARNVARRRSPGR